jgi:AraC family transcriptional regulator of adaptative response/methylated-DNA-[protein]-cysteine methyltransferase
VPPSAHVPFRDSLLTRLLQDALGGKSYYVTSAELRTPVPFISPSLGLSALAFADAGHEDASLDDMRSRWPEARFVEDATATAGPVARIFNPGRWKAKQPLRIVFIGTEFETKVWQTLLKIPLGSATTYSDIAGHIGSPKASRAVGAAVGRNPISFVVPCHRVLGKSGSLCGYHWGLTRKQAILGWEAGLLTGGSRAA